MVNEKVAQLQKQLDDRNEATKVWIQAETQTRAYCCELERKVAAYRKALENVRDEQIVTGEPMRNRTELENQLTASLRNIAIEALEGVWREEISWRKSTPKALGSAYTQTAREYHSRSVTTHPRRRIVG